MVGVSPMSVPDVAKLEGQGRQRTLSGSASPGHSRNDLSGEIEKLSVARQRSNSVGDLISGVPGDAKLCFSCHEEINCRTGSQI